MQHKISKENVENIYALNMMQKGMLFHFLKEEKSNLYNVQLTMEIQGEINVECLNEAFLTLQANNEVLRSVFNWDKASQPLQIILKKQSVDFVFNDFTSEDRQSLVFEKYLIDDQKKRFDLTSHAYRVALIKTGHSSFTFIITHHHILYDGWSTGILLKELFSYYDQILKQKEVEVIEKTPYETVQKALGEKYLSEAENSFWKEYLIAYEPQSFFPFLDSKKNNEEITKLTFEAPLQVLSDFAAAHHVTQAAVLYTAYGLLLQIYQNSPDVVFGTTVSNRDGNIHGMDNVVGNFINTIPLRLKESPNKSLIEIVIDVNKALIERNEFNKTSYFEIKQLLNIDARQPLFDTALVVENYPLDEKIIRENEHFNLSLRSLYENTDLPLLIAIYLKDPMIFEVTIKEALVDKTFVESFIGDFIKVLEQIIKQGDEKAETLTILSEIGLKDLLETLNDTSTKAPEKLAPLDLFRSQVKKTPDNIAIEFKENQLTYAQLDHLSNKIGAYLQTTKGVGSLSRVGVFLNRSEQLIPYLLGIIKTGAAFVPIDPTLPSARVSSIVSSADLNLMIIDNLALDSDNKNWNILNIEEVSLENLDDANFEKVPIKHDDLLYIIYTSGSTGEPKGVMITHGNVGNYLMHAANHYLPASCKASFALFTSISFDLTITSIFTPLVTGSKLMVYEESADPLLVEQVIKGGKSNVFKLTPSHLRIIKESTWIKENFESLGAITFIVGGEMLESYLAQSIHKLFSGNIKIYNEYGPTEATVGCMVYEYNPADTTLSVPIGMPIHNTQVYILDRYQRLLPVGVAGELHVSGAGLSPGYFNNELLTCEKFITHPFIDGKKIYKTGDKVLWDKDAKILFLGRMDEQLKIRGYRIEPGEIAHHLLKYEEVKEVRVCAKSINEEPYLVAYYTANEEIATSSFRKHLSALLPHYMIPDYYVNMSTFPLTQNGKLDIDALPHPSFGSQNAPKAATSKTEHVLMSIWAEVLKSDNQNMGINQSFFDLGGHSLKAITLVNKIHSKMNVRISVKEVFDNDTIAELADYLETIMHSGTNLTDTNNTIEIVI